MKELLTRNPRAKTRVLADAMRRSAARSLFVLLAAGGILAPALPVRAGDGAEEAPLPEPGAFLNEVRERLHSDEYLLDQYTFAEKHTERRFDGKGNVKKVTSAAYEVYPSPDPRRTYRKLVARNGSPLTAEELAKEDRKQTEKEAKAAAREAAQDVQKHAATQEERRRKEAAAIEDLFRVYDIRIVGREALDGRDAILFTFAPRQGAEAATKAGKVAKKFAGRAWIDEEDRQLVRVEAELIDDLSYGLGILAKLKKGCRARIERRKVNGEIWLPSEAHFVGQARLLLVKGLNIDALSEYSDYKKFTVGTEATVTPEQEK